MHGSSPATLPQGLDRGQGDVAVVFKPGLLITGLAMMVLLKIEMKQLDRSEPDK
jgi:hypothetical protein